MRSVTRWVLAAVLTAVAAGAAVAQPPGGRGGMMMMGGGGTGMLYGQLATSKILAEELKLTDEQKEKLKKELEPIQKAQREMFSGFRPGGERPSEEAMKEMREKGQKIQADMKKAVEGVLKAEQTKRLTEIGYQQAGVAAFGIKEVQDALKLTEGQQEKIKGVVEQYGKDSRELRFGGGRQQGGERPSREEMAKRMAEMRKKTEALSKDAMEKIEEVLKDDQKDTWKGLVGKKFDTAKLQEEMQANMMRQFRRDD